MARGNGGYNSIVSRGITGATTRGEFLEAVIHARHLCIRELLKIITPGRWQSPEILEDVCRRYGHKRLLLREFAVEKLFPGMHEALITISSMPRGSWSAPITDQVVLAKLARLLQPANILEVGSFRGYTARLLAENTASYCLVHALDTDPNHGEAYKNSSVSNRIMRHLGSLGDSLPESLKGFKFDLIFIDADHQFIAVERDTRAIFPLLAERGLLLWHDYSDWGWMSTWNRVPEFLYNMSKEIPILSIPGTTLAVHRQGWTEQAVAEAIDDWNRHSPRSHWDSAAIRGES